MRKKLRILDFWNIRFSGGSPTNRTGNRGTENRVGCVSLWMRKDLENFFGLFLLFLVVSTGVHFICKPLSRGVFHVFRPRLWQVLWSGTLPASDRRFSAGAEREAFHIFAVCIVTLAGRFCNGFLPEQALKFCGTISKDKDRRSNRKAQCRMSKSCMGNQSAEEYSKLALESVC